MDSRLYILSVDKDPSEATRIAFESASKIEKKEIKFIELVQGLAEHLTDDDKTQRAKAIGYLSAVLDALGSKSTKSLTKQQIPVVTTFFVDRLEDEAGLKEAAIGLAALARFNGFGEQDAMVVMRFLLGIDLAKHPPSTRFAVLTLFDSLMSRHRNAFKAMGDGFLTGLANLIGGEKDPRNLMVVFSVMKVVLIEFDIVRHTELMFDVVYCYFPITFRAPADDPYGITAQDLKLRLRECIASTRYFSGQVFPSLIEKLDSTSLAVKLDVLETMTACCLSYGPQTISAQATQIWDAVKYEVLNGAVEDDLASEALQTIRAVAISLSTGLVIIPPPTTPLARYLKMICKECIKLLQEPQQKQAKPAAQILASVGTASAASCSFVIQSILPTLLLLFADIGILAKQRALLEILNMFFESVAQVYGTWTDNTTIPALDQPLLEHRDTLFEIYSQGLMGSNKDEASYRLTAMRGLLRMALIRGYLNESEIGMIVQYFNEIALHQEERQELRDEALQSLKDVSKFKGNIVMQLTFPAFMAVLPDKDSEVSEYEGTLEALAKLSSERSVFDVLLTRLLNKLDVVLSNGTGPAYPRAILSALLYALHNKSSGTQDDNKSCYSRLVPTLISRSVCGRSRVMTDDSVADITGRLVNVIVRTMDADQQSNIIQDMWDLFVNGEPSGLVKDGAAEVANTFRPFDEHVPEDQADCLGIFAASLAATRKEVLLPTDSLQKFLSLNISRAQQPKSAASRLAHLHIIGILVNKFITDDGDRAYLHKITLEILESFNDSNMTPAVLNENLRIIFWIAKALILKADRLGQIIVSSLIALLSSHTLGVPASRGFAILLGPDEFLSKQNHAFIRLLSKQQTFSTCLPLLTSGFKSSNFEKKTNYLIALSNLIKYLDPVIIKPQLTSLIPLLLQSMDLNDLDVKMATIETLHITVVENAQAVKEHIGSLISRLIVESESDSEVNSVHVRILALKALRSFPGALRTELLLPYKRQVLMKLTKPLDDPKRAVRAEAVATKLKWWSVDELME